MKASSPVWFALLTSRLAVPNVNRNTNTDVGTQKFERQGSSDA